MTPLTRLFCGIPAVALLLSAGCASTDSMFAHHDSPCVGNDCRPETFVQFERGQPNVVVDAVGWVFGIPSRILLWNWGVANHDISPETEQHIRQYVAAQGIPDVKVRLNQYDPGGEWLRLARNKRVGAGWRYTIGALSTFGYSVLPGRLFGLDYYNPFTNTVNVYSDVAALGMQESAYAKDVIGRDLPGTYAFAQLIPGVNLVHETITTRDVLDYVDVSGDTELRRETVHVLYPRYGGSFGGGIGYWIPPAATALQLGGYVVGHVTGRWETRGWPASTEPDLLLSETDAQPLAKPAMDISVPDAEATSLFSEGSRLGNPFEKLVAIEPSGTEIVPASFEQPVTSSPDDEETSQGKDDAE